jgi:hypothetical protein
MISARGKSIFSLVPKQRPHSLGTRLPAAWDTSGSSRPSRARSQAPMPCHRESRSKTGELYTMYVWTAARECVPLGGHSRHSQFLWDQFNATGYLGDHASDVAIRWLGPECEMPITPSQRCDPRLGKFL